jgi:hypothetical protein
MKSVRSGIRLCDPACKWSHIISPHTEGPRFATVHNNDGFETRRPEISESYKKF